MEPIRSLLFVPGNRRDMLEKARTLDADALVPDLEDSVPPGEKLRARQTVAELAPTLAARGQKVIPRINALDTGLSYDELDALVGPHIWGFSVGKARSPEDIRHYDRILAEVETRHGLPVGSMRLLPWIETARGVLRALDILTASPRIQACAFGAEDFTVDMGIQRTDDGQEVSVARALVVMAARAADVWPLDTPTVNFRDPEALRRDILDARRVGMKGKFAIHPSQIEPINTLFMPSKAELEEARRVVQGYEEAEAQGRGAFSLDGKMIDTPVVKRARNLLAFAEAVARRQKGD